MQTAVTVLVLELVGLLALSFLGQMDTNQARPRVGPYRCRPSLLQLLRHCLLPQAELRRAGPQAALVGLITIISWVIKHKDGAGVCGKGLSARGRATTVA